MNENGKSVNVTRAELEHHIRAPVGCRPMRGGQTGVGNGPASEVEEKLYELAKGPGVRRSNLYEALGVQLRRLWGIQDPTDPVFEMVEWHLEWLIAQIRPDDTTAAFRRASDVISARKGM